MNIRFFDKHVVDLIKGLDKQTRTKASRLFRSLEEYGHLLRMPFSRKIHDNLFELRVVGVIHIRFFYTFYKGEAVIVHAFVKKTDRIPQYELNSAIVKAHLCEIDRV